MQYWLLLYNSYTSWPVDNRGRKIRSPRQVQTMLGLVESQEVLVRWVTNFFFFYELTTFECQKITNTIKDTLTYLKTCIQSNK